MRALVIVRLRERLQPLDRGARYEDPLDGYLREEALGSVTGGGTQLGESGEVEYCEIEFDLVDASPETIGALTRALEHLGAPLGSSLTVDGRESPIGSREGLALYLNGTDLPDEVYRDSDVNVVFDELDAAIEGIGSVRSYWEGPTETALYLYGTSFEALRAAIQPFVDSYPLCQRARLVRIA